MPTTNRPFDYRTTLRQIGPGNVMAVSGGRYHATGGEQAGGRHPMVMALTLPVACGYSVRVTLNALDLYDVERVFRRGHREWVKRTWTDVYADQLGETVYQASCYKDGD